MNQIKETLRLKECELSVRQISKAVNISRPKVSECLSKFEQLNLNYELVKDMPDSELSKLLYAKKKNTKRYEKLYDYFPEYLKRLKQKGMTLQLLWEEYKNKHPDGLYYSRFCYHFYKWRKSAKLDMHIEHKAGDKMFVDFTGDKLSYYDKALNKFKEIEVFVAILGASQLTYVEAVESQKKHDWIKVNDNTLHYFGGITQAIVPDCLKSGVTKANKYEPDINPEYADFARHYNTTILPARPYRAKDKPLVENAVKIIYTRIFVPIRKQTFYSLEELNEAIRYYLEKHNNKNFQKINISRRGLFNETEKDVLMSLPAERYKIKNFLRPKVQCNYHIYLKEDNHYYSVHYKHIGKYVTVIYNDTVVEIYYNNERIALHRRDRSTNKYTTLAEHMPPNHQLYAKWSPQKLINWGEGKGEYVKEMVESMLKTAKHPEQAFKSCLGLLNLSGKYGNMRLNNACARSLAYESYSYKRVKNILEKGLDKWKEDITDNQPLPAHENIRGSQYYN